MDKHFLQPPGSAFSQSASLSHPTYQSSQFAEVPSDVCPSCDQSEDGDGEFSTVEVSADINIPHMQYSHTNVALEYCKRNVLAPYLRLMMVLGWRPIPDEPQWRISSCLCKVMNIIYPVIVVAIIILGYVLQFAASLRTDKMVYLGHNATMPLFGDKVSSYPIRTLHMNLILPDLLHLCAYFHAFYAMRYGSSEYIHTLMETVFVQTSPYPFSGYLSQKNLIRALRLLLLLGLVWLLLSIGDLIFRISLGGGLVFSEWIRIAGKVGDIVLTILLIMCLAFIHLVYITIITGYAVQCQLLIYAVRGLGERVYERAIPLQEVYKEIQETYKLLKTLNNQSAMTVSLLMYNFCCFTALIVYALITHELITGWVSYAHTVTALILWTGILFIPLIQAARVTASFSSLSKLGHAIRARPFGYQDTDADELDSLLLFLATFNLQAKIFQIPVKSAYLFGVTLPVAFIIVFLCQVGAIGDGY